jgi:hypothetical protein
VIPSPTTPTAHPREQPGGYAFYDDEEDGIDDLPSTRYLEAAPVETEWESVWGGFGTEVGAAAQGTAVGTGAANTAAIVAAYGAAEPDEGRTDYAARVASDLTHNGYDDWFMPSKDELSLMYQHLDGVMIGGFSASIYWCSSESNSSIAWFQDFGDGHENGSGGAPAARIEG